MESGNDPIYPLTLFCLRMLHHLDERSYCLVEYPANVLIDAPYENFICEKEVTTCVNRIWIK